MIALDLKSYYSRFLEGHEGQLHFAAHSHHFWPDISREAQMNYWDDCALMSDEKWSKIFGEVIPSVQTHIARILKLTDPTQIAFAPNTHELATRVLSCFLGKSKVRIVTGTNEFHSWKRQYLRLTEMDSFEVDLVDTTNLLVDRPKVIHDLKKSLESVPDVLFISQVFFDSGLAFKDEELQDIVKAARPETLIIIDGYHGFAAIPTNLSSLEGRVFYLGGGYKYAQAGEGVGFLVVPKGNWRPAYTGWFADYGNLSTSAGKKVGYSSDAMAFMGATQDPSGLYRFRAVWDQFHADGISVELIHNYVVDLQKCFLGHLPKSFCLDWKLKSLFENPIIHHGHFLTFEAPELGVAEELQNVLKDAQVLIDRRGLRLRFGFGTYQDQEDVKELCIRLGQI